ncbi:condensation domain-containing protein, partial [Pseudomonas syringae]|uniref:condensation domain-containing protein n=1 Tax=Pseudomonas syringae TaxID=317 RepID=UPI0013C2E21D
MPELNDRNESLEQLKRAAMLRLLQQRGATRAERAPLDAIEPADRSVPLPLSFAQQRLWFLDQLDPTASAAYHMPAALRLTGTLDKPALKAALDHLVVRHESLRTTFRRNGEHPVQVIADTQSGFSLVEQDLRGLSSEQARLSAARISDAEAAEPFDLLAGPLIRGRLLQLNDEEHLLLITQHHIISDGWSIEVLVREFSALYRAFVGHQASPLTPLP